MSKINGYVGFSEKPAVSSTFYMWKANNQRAILADHGVAYKNKEEYTNAFLKEDTRSLFDGDEIIEKEAELADSVMQCDELAAIDKELTFETILDSKSTNVMQTPARGFLQPIAESAEILPLIS